MKRADGIKAIGAIVAIAEADRQIREVKGLVDRSLLTAQRYWPVLPLFAAGWAFMVSDEGRYGVLEQLADRVLDALPVETVERLLGA